MRGFGARAAAPLRYVRLDPDGALPALGDGTPFKAVIAADAPVGALRRHAICVWLVETGCRYLLPHGPDSEAWCETLRAVNLAAFDIDTMDPADFVMATPHPHESLRGVLWFAKKAAVHPEHDFDGVVVLHVSREDRPGEFHVMFDKA